MTDQHKPHWIGVDLAVQQRATRFVLVERVSSNRSGHPVYLKCMTGIGPMCTSKPGEAQIFDSRDQAVASPAFAFALASFEPEEAPTMCALREATDLFPHDVFARRPKKPLAIARPDGSIGVSIASAYQFMSLGCALNLRARLNMAIEQARAIHQAGEGQPP